jgi:hypothetical protein
MSSASVRGQLEVILLGPLMIYAGHARNRHRSFPSAADRARSTSAEQAPGPAETPRVVLGIQEGHVPLIRLVRVSAAEPRRLRPAVDPATPG